MLSTLYKQRRLIGAFWGTELRRRYAGTLLGPVWAVLPSAMTVTAFWFVFEVGLRAQGVGRIPYFFYFTVGILPWFLFFDSFATSVNTISDNRHLITKMVFPAEVLPVVNALVASVPHLFILIGMCVGLYFSELLSIETLPWILYFYVCTILFALGVSWLVSSIAVFSRDAGSAALIGVGLIFWITPIMWQMDAIPVYMRAVFEWNPLTYVATGYRFALYNGAAPSPEFHAKFWLVTGSVWFLGTTVFNRLKHHFADVL